MIFDTHTHLNVEEFAGHEAEEIALAAEMGVTQDVYKRQICTVSMMMSNLSLIS